MSYMYVHFTYQLITLPPYPFTSSPPHFPIPLSVSMQVCWTPFLAAFSVAMRDSDEPDIVFTCLDAFRCAIRVACIFGLTVSVYHIYMYRLMHIIHNIILCTVVSPAEPII